MRVKKPTSKRTTTRMREGIKKKLQLKEEKIKSQRKTLHGNQENQGSRYSSQFSLQG